MTLKINKQNIFYQQSSLSFLLVHLQVSVRWSGAWPVHGEAGCSDQEP